MDCREINQILLQSNCQTGEQTRSSNVFVCLSNAVRFVLCIISIYRDIWISPVNNACILKHFNGIIYPIWIAWTIPSVVCASDILKFPRGWHVYLALNDHPNRESIFQRKEIQRRFILPLYPEKSQHKPKGWNVPEKIINNSNIPPIGEILCANYHRF